MIKKCQSLTLKDRKCGNKAKYCLTSSGQKINICYSHMKYYKNKNSKVSNTKTSDILFPRKPSRVSAKNILKRKSTRVSNTKYSNEKALRKFSQNKEKISRNSYEYDVRKNKLSVKRVSRVPHDKLTNLPIRYTRGLTSAQKLKYLKEINETKNYYASTGRIKGRSPVSSLKPKRSKFVEEFEKKYNFNITNDEKLRSFFPDTDIDMILSKGRAAYASGSRPTVTGSSGPERWARARLASVLVGGKALSVDKDLVGPKSLRKIFS